MGKKKNSATKAALKHLLKGTTIGGGVNIYDDNDVAVPKGELSIGKGNTSISGSVLGVFGSRGRSVPGKIVRGPTVRLERRGSFDNS